MSGWRIFDAKTLPGEVKAELARSQPHEGVTTGMISLVSAFVSRSLKHIGARISGRFDDVEARLAALEQRPSLSYRGVWDPRSEYREGEFVTDQGSVWYARRTTRERPGSSADFQLAVKRGADGKKEAR